MEPNEIMMRLRGAAAKWEATHPIIGVGQLRVHDALNDAADCIERLQAELEASHRRERAAVEEARQSCGNCAHSGKTSCPWEGTYHKRGLNGEKIGVCNAWEWRGPEKEGEYGK